MKAIKIRILIFIFISGIAVSLQAGTPTAYLNFASFTTPSGQNYFETYLSVQGSSLKFVKNANNKYVAKVHVIIGFRHGDSVVATSNFNVLSPEVNDTLSKPDFIDVHRFWLDKGNYTLVFTMDDPNDAAQKVVSGKQPVHIGYPSDSIRISDAEFLSSFTPSGQQSPYNKCGFNMIPYVFGNYPPAMKKLVFYCDIYNTVKFVPREKITIKYSIEDDGAYSLNLSHHFASSVQRDADTVVPFLAQVPLDDLPSGNYFLLVSVSDINNHVLATRKYSFSRINPVVKASGIPSGFGVYMQNRDTLEESIRCLAPISNYSEQAYVMSDSLNWVSMDELKRFFYYFWQSRDSANPLEGWQKYLDKVMAVDNSFNAVGVKGYRTDRGRVYLQYGAPNIRHVETNNPATYPYEIWQYYRLPDGQTSVEFVFYSTTIETNDYVLLHSTATGEVKNPHWEVELYSRFGTPSDLDQQKIKDQLGEDVNDQFNNPH
jgi:GWxTD domain-containing protein